MGKVNLSRICKLVDVASNDKSVADSFLADLSYAIRKYAENNSPETVSKSYKPSSLHCIRNMYYQLVGQTIQVNNAISSDFIGICESGTARHNDIQNAISHMKELGFDCEYVDVAEYVKEHSLPNIEIIDKCGNETKLFNSQYNIRFLCDGIIKYQGKYYILEIKTETSFKWNSRTDVDDSHKLQATAYSLSLGLNEVIFLYENRDLCSKKCFTFKVTDDMRNELVAKINTCDNCVANNKVPNMPFIDYNNKHCRYCSYIEQCKKDS